MEFRYLGNSGLKISEITYGNWLTHGSQVENDVAAQCVRAALDAGISTFDTAENMSMQSGPVVVDRVLYFTTDTSTYAIDAGTCREIVATADSGRQYRAYYRFT